MKLTSLHKKASYITVTWLLFAGMSSALAQDNSSNGETQSGETMEVEVVTETITMPLSDKQFKSNQPMPKRGMSEAKVKAAFGEPVEAFPARGEPPISRWVYPEFTVYFESGWVIHTVLKTKK